MWMFVPAFLKILVLSQMGYLSLSFNVPVPRGTTTTSTADNGIFHFQRSESGAHEPFLHFPSIPGHF
jgi:hypothetical protein